ncbi:hypothetical protein Lal_00014081 [Lupinus albus]|nr:hypothetical protein Lal_00014081 [Lupinus albus]
MTLGTPTTLTSWRISFERRLILRPRAWPKVLLCVIDVDCVCLNCLNCEQVINENLQHLNQNINHHPNPPTLAPQGPAEYRGLDEFC